MCDLDTRSGNILTHIAEHFPQFLIVRKMAPSNKNVTYYQRDYSKFDEEKFIEDFNNFNFDYLNDSKQDVNSKFTRFLANLYDTAEKHALLNKFSKQDRTFQNKPWINSTIRKMIRVRDKLLKKLRKKPDPAVNLAYKKLRNRVACKLEESKQSYYQNYFNVNSNNMKVLWTGIKSIIRSNS